MSPLDETALPDTQARTEARRPPLFRLGLPGPVARFGEALERLLAVDRVNEVYDRCAGAGDPREFLERVLRTLGVRYQVTATDLERVPRTGPLVVVANHPLGAVDGIVLAAALASIRPDVKVMANYLLGQIPELRDLFLCVDPFGGANAVAANRAPVREAMRWLARGGAMATFPAGEVAHLDLGRREVTDPPWSATIAGLARRAGAAVLPVYFTGRNGPLFQLAGLLHPRLRTAMLAREMFRQRGVCLEMRVGPLIEARQVAEFEGDDAALTQYLRRRTFLLAHRQDGTGPATSSVAGSALAPRRTQSTWRLPRMVNPWRAWRGSGKPLARETVEAIVAPVDAELLAQDVASLPAEQRLVEHDEYVVFEARAPQIRHVLREIGRLREVTFRAAGEGTGRAIDLDTFDYDYVHLFIWNTARRDVVGAYRLGRADELVAAKGRQGLYTSTLFEYGRADLLRRTGPALEMGRSFVRGEYQRSYAPLLLLWKGIGHYVVRHPRYRCLFGAVSISNRYGSVSKQLMVKFLTLHHAPVGRDGLVRPRRPYQAPRLGGLDWLERDEPATRAILRGESDVSDLVAQLEPDGKGLPVLLRQYLKLGAKILAFNVDPDFNDALDALIVVDLTKTDARVLERYMGKDGYRRFMSHHAPVSKQPSTV